MSNTGHSDSLTDSFLADGLAPLFDRYEILGLIGQGGMGIVYKGYHLSLKRPVAIKVLRLDRLRGDELAGRFLREMHAVGQMDHANVVRATDAGQKDGLFYLVMEYLEGENLSQLADRRGKLELADACELVRQAALGLDYIHKTLIHRDIKPSNLLLTPAGVVKVLDLGLARLHEAALANQEQTPEGRVLGTFDYMAPEQASASGPIDGRADIYSLGFTLFKFLTGQVPFTGPAFDSVARKLYAHGHTLLSEVAEFASVPEALRPILLHMTAKNPCDRYATAGEVARALEGFAAGSRSGSLCEGAVESVRPVPEELRLLTSGTFETRPTDLPPSAQSPPAPLRRRRGLWIGVGVLACALVVAVGLAIPALFPRRDGGTEGDPDLNGASQSLVEGPGGKQFPGVRRLDELELDIHHPLLDRPPVVVGIAAGRPGAWRQDAGRQHLEVKGSKNLFFLLGTTARARFKLEAGIAQSPWTGNVGVFWGYREVAEVKNAKASGEEFAWFQFASVVRQVSDRGLKHDYVQRGRYAVFCDKFGEVQLKSHLTCQHKLPLLAAGEKILVVTVEPNRLASAWLGSIELTDITSPAANKHMELDPYAGGMGVFSISHQATFANVRFVGN